ncbi:MAG: cobalamin B12-binding domain-containing protein [Deltaproteobacteria bacterium]|nr:cobalamin B12-binding domain-containing protein [Deltaproteobacteria bacterium]
MRALFVLPPLNRAKFGPWHRLMQPMPPLGVASVAAVLEGERAHVRIVDMFAEGLRDGGLARIVEREQPDLVGLSMLTPSAPTVVALARLVRVKAPRAIVVLGGIHASLFPEQLLGDGTADIVVHGEGEWTARDLCRTLAGGRPLSGVAGISFFENGRVQHTAPRPPISDLDALPFPAWHLVPVVKYGLLPFADMARPVLTISGSRGCPFRCSYCSLPETGKLYRTRSPASIVDEIEYAAGRFGIRQIGFIDPIFPLTDQQVEGVCGEMIRRGIPDRVVWLSETRADLMTPARLRLMRRAGCGRLLFGIESGDASLLEKVNKRVAVDRNGEAVRAAREAGIQTVGLFMLGLPGETPEQCRRTIDYAVDLGLDFAKFAITVPFPGSPLYDEMTRAGTLDRTDWENFTTFNPDPDLLVLATTTITGRELLDLQWSATARFYLRPSLIIRHLLGIRTLSMKNIAYGALALLARRDR